MKKMLALAALATLFAAPAFAQVEPPTNTPLVLSKTTVEETPDATIEKTTETIIPISDRPALDPENPIAPEVQAVVDRGPLAGIVGAYYLNANAFNVFDVRLYTSSPALPAR